MKEITLKSGLKVLLDESDYDAVSKYHWFSFKSRLTHYAEASYSIKGKRYCLLMHRLIMDAKKGQIVDHINGNGLDNRRSNLRIVTHKENALNKRKSRNTSFSSRYKGVSFTSKYADNRNWIAQIKINNKSITLGRYATQEEAALAYNNGAMIHFGEYAYLNEVPNG